MAWTLKKKALDEGLSEYYRSFIPGITHKQYCRYVEKAYKEEIVLSPITFIAIVKGIDNEKATEIFFEKSKELTDSGKIPVPVPIVQVKKISNEVAAEIMRDGEVSEV
jgi:hypothetical protein